MSEAGNKTMGYPLPGQSSGRTVTPRQIFWQYPTTDARTLGSDIIIASTARDNKNAGYTSELRAGMLLGRVTATNRYVPCKRTVATAAATTSSDTTLPVEDSGAFLAGDSIKIGWREAESTTGDDVLDDALTEVSATILSVDYTTDVITLTAGKDWPDGAMVYGTDGSQTCRGVLDRTVDLYDPDTRATREMSASLIVAGWLLSGMMVGDLNAILEDATSKNLLRGIRFDSEWGL